LCEKKRRGKRSLKRNRPFLGKVSGKGKKKNPPPWPRKKKRDIDPVQRTGGVRGKEKKKKDSMPLRGKGKGKKTKEKAVDFEKTEPDRGSLKKGDKRHPAKGKMGGEICFFRGKEKKRTSLFSCIAYGEKNWGGGSLQHFARWKGRGEVKGGGGGGLLCPFEKMCDPQKKKGEKTPKKVAKHLSALRRKTTPRRGKKKRFFLIGKKGPDLREKKGGGKKANNFL